MRNIGFVILAVSLLAEFSVAQSPDRLEVFGGYSYITSDFTGSVSGRTSLGGLVYEFRTGIELGVTVPCCRICGFFNYLCGIFELVHASEHLRTCRLHVVAESNADI